jgi:hypothetical protein
MKIEFTSEQKDILKSVLVQITLEISALFHVPAGRKRGMNFLCDQHLNCFRMVKKKKKKAP